MTAGIVVSVYFGRSDESPDSDGSSVQSVNDDLPQAQETGDRRSNDATSGVSTQNAGGSADQEGRRESVKVSSQPDSAFSSSDFGVIQAPEDSERIANAASQSESDDSENIAKESREAEPACWLQSTNLPENYYTVDQDQDEVFAGKSSVRFGSNSENAQWGSLWQSINAAAYAGKRVEFSAFLKFQDAAPGVSLYVMTTDANGVITGGGRLDWISGSMDWHSRSLVLDIPSDSAALTYAFNILGQGTLWVDDARIVTVGDAVELTYPERNPRNGRGGIALAPDVGSLPGAPLNTDFEIWGVDSEHCHSPAQ